MEDEQSNMSSTGFSSRSLMIRQLLAAAYGLLVNFIITQFLVRFVDEDFRNWSLKRTLVLSLASMLLAFIFRKLKKYLQSQSYGDEYSEVDGAAPGLDVSADYSAFTCFRFPALDQNPQRLMPADSEGTIRERRQVSEALGSSSLSEQPQPSQQPPPPPSYQLQWVTSSPSSYSHQRFLPSAPLSESSSFRPASLPRLASAWPVTRKKSVRKSMPRNMYRNHASNTTQRHSSPELGPWAFHFLEEHNFAEFQNEYSWLRNINVSSFHRDEAVRVEASPRSKFEASDMVTEAAPVSAGEISIIILSSDTTAKTRTAPATLKKIHTDNTGCTFLLASVVVHIHYLLKLCSFCPVTVNILFLCLTSTRSLVIIEHLHHRPS